MECVDGGSLSLSLSLSSSRASKLALQSIEQKHGGSEREGGSCFIKPAMKITLTFPFLSLRGDPPTTAMFQTSSRVITLGIIPTLSLSHSSTSKDLIHLCQRSTWISGSCWVGTQLLRERNGNKHLEWGDREGGCALSVIPLIFLVSSKAFMKSHVYEHLKKCGNISSFCLKESVLDNIKLSWRMWRV